MKIDMRPRCELYGSDDVATDDDGGVIRWFQPNDDDQARVILGTWYQVPTNRNCTKLDPEVHFESRTLKLGKWCNKKGHVRIGCQGNSDTPSQIGEWTHTDHNWQKCSFVQCYHKKQFVAFSFICSWSYDILFIVINDNPTMVQLDISTGHLGPKWCCNKGTKWNQ